MSSSWCQRGLLKSVLFSPVFALHLSFTAACISQPLLSKCSPFRTNGQLALLADNGRHMSQCIFMIDLEFASGGVLLMKTLLKVMQSDRHDCEPLILLRQGLKNVKEIFWHALHGFYFFIVFKFYHSFLLCSLPLNMCGQYVLVSMNFIHTVHIFPLSFISFQMLAVGITMKYM